MSERFELPQPEIDTSKRYDVYCHEMGVRIVVYRKALFKGVKRLLSSAQFDIGSDFIELEQANGQTVYLSKMSVIKFCEPGVEFTSEEISPKQ
ncbi:MAG: hypothetical protein ABSG14_09835 [Verrucomicrobiia bacterium]|jgi:hypothetical protein